uniref:Putative ATPase domain containing protein n=1 Tax=viral metagenome TaxID=1070528 RepID=A0A6M3K3K8_9ZZZZ
MASHKIAVLTGGPGTGKTEASKAVLSWAKENHMKIAVAAPTGKAAKRISEAINYEASTIHRLLEPRMGNNGNFVFQRDEKNPLDIDLLILDEVSMIDNRLMASILRALDTNKTKLLLIGDAGQLPSVGPGSILRDLLASKKIPHVELDEIFRNSGDIVKACHRIKDGKYYKPSPTLDPDNGLNLRHIECRDMSRIQEIIRQIVTKRMVERGYDPMWDVQVLSPTNTRTDLSCEALNKVLQAELNSSPVVDGTIFRVNDKVIQIKNEKIKTPSGGEELVVNGDMGTILDIPLKKKQIILKFDNPERTVVAPLRGHNLLLGYCITCHRFQGSEAPVVIVPVHSGFNFFITRPWLYTALSRGQSIVITVGEFSAIKKAIDTEMPLHRKTMLMEKLLQ